MKKLSCFIAALICAVCFVPCFSGCANEETALVLRVSSWEEYIDLGGWDEEIEVENPFSDDRGNIIGVNSVEDDFCEWFNKTHDFNVKLEYSTFGTNEDLYNRLSLGDAYDVVCPSDYMIMKLLDEDMLLPYSDGFFSGDYAYYSEYASPYIKGVFEDNGWEKYAACYMWGTTGLVYNPEKVDAADVSTWKVLRNGDYKKQVTIKDNVRDAYFATLAAINSEALLNTQDGDARSDILNDTSDETLLKAENALKDIKDNVYSFETDSGKADMVTGKVLVNYQWSGDAVYIMNEAEEDEKNSTELWYSVPDECTNLWFDGWVLMKDGVGGDENRRIAAEAFVNFMSRPDIAVRNMDYIGYTSAIAGDTVFEYLEYNYGAESEDTYAYDVSYFFGEDRTIETDICNFEFDGDRINRGRQLFAQYPSADVIDRSAVMRDFGERLKDVNKMWINVRCLDIKDVSSAVWISIAVIAVAAVAGTLLYVFRYRLFIKHRPKKGYGYEED